MTCPFELPVKPKDKCKYTEKDVIEIIDSRNNGYVATVRNIAMRDYIVQAINSHEKLVESLQKVVDDHPAGLHTPTEPASLAQARQILKEAEKT